MDVAALASNKSVRRMVVLKSLDGCWMERGLGMADPCTQVDCLRVGLTSASWTPSFFIGSRAPHQKTLLLGCACMPFKNGAGSAPFGRSDCGARAPGAACDVFCRTTDGHGVAQRKSPVARHRNLVAKWL